jgi:hypothetical protein
MGTVLQLECGADEQKARFRAGLLAAAWNLGSASVFFRFREHPVVTISRTEALLHRVRRLCCSALRWNYDARLVYHRNPPSSFAAA